MKLADARKDHYRRLAHEQGFRARSAFKLKELNKSYRIIGPGFYVLDLGCAPGGWTQVAAEIITNGKILSIDIKDMESVKNAKCIKGDILEEKTKNTVIEYFTGKLDVIVSDMAADTTGSKSLDSIRTNQLCTDVIEFSKFTLKPKGVLVSKLFMGEDFIEVKKLAKSIFKNVNFFKPESSRSESKETYIHCEILRTL